MTSQKYVRTPEILKVIPVSGVALRQWEQKGLFPKAFRLGSGRFFWWDRAEVNAWLRDHGMDELPEAEEV